jgi:hypothetical protein
MDSANNVSKVAFNATLVEHVYNVEDTNSGLPMEIYSHYQELQVYNNVF